MLRRVPDHETAAPRLTLSSVVMSFLLCGSQTEALYSMMERTNVKYACSRSFRGQKRRLRHRKPILALAFPVMLLICGAQVRSSVMVTPRYLAWSTCLRMRPPSEYIRVRVVHLRCILIISHFDALKRIPHLVPHCSRLRRSC